MKITQIEKLNQLISRTDMTGNQKVEWLTKFIDEHVTEQLRLHIVSKSLPIKKYEIDFGGNVLAGLEITNNEPTVIGAMNGWGNGIDIQPYRSRIVALHITFCGLAKKPKRMLKRITNV